MVFVNYLFFIYLVDIDWVRYCVYCWGRGGEFELGFVFRKFGKSIEIDNVE